jgi:TPR repeat protein
MKHIFTAITFLTALSLPVYAQDFQKGVAAYNAGDFASAVKEFRPFAEAGGSVSQYNLGLMYKNGQGVPQDYKEALKWYRLAVEQGYAMAQNNLGLMYAKGHGVLQDNAIAHMWYNIGAANGDDLGGNNRDNLAKQMTPADISKAQAMARECMNSGYTKCGY